MMEHWRNENSFFFYCSGIDRCGFLRDGSCGSVFSARFCSCCWEKCQSSVQYFSFQLKKLPPGKRVIPEPAGGWTVTEPSIELARGHPTFGEAVHRAHRFWRRINKFFLMPWRRWNYLLFTFVMFDEIFSHVARNSRFSSGTINI